jgi:hypothetical protein
MHNRQRERLCAWLGSKSSDVVSEQEMHAVEPRQPADALWLEA